MPTSCPWLAGLATGLSLVGLSLGLLCNRLGYKYLVGLSLGLLCNRLGYKYLCTVCPTSRRSSRRC